MESLSRCLTWTCCFHIRIRFCWVGTGQPCSVWSDCGKVEELLIVGVGLSHLCYVSVILLWEVGCVICPAMPVQQTEQITAFDRRYR